MRKVWDTKTSLSEHVWYPVNPKRVGFIRSLPLRLLSLLRVDAAFTLSNNHAGGVRPTQPANLYITVNAPTHPGAAADTNLTVAESSGSPTRAVVGNPGIVLSSESIIHGAEKAVETMKIYEGAVGKIRLVMNVGDSVAEVCTPSLSLSTNATTHTV